MLDYSVQVGEFDEELPDSSVSEKIGINPFPGLRPFTLDESHLFFGREGQVDEILLKLSQHRSVTVMGYSGSGKSSLMQCGLIPVLYGGFMTDSSPFWEIVFSRPGDSPIKNLVSSIVSHLIAKGKIEESDADIHKAIISSVLKSGPNGLVEVAKFFQSQKDENIFFLVDQFEELFRYSEVGDEFSNEAIAFVNLILHAVHQREVPVYIALSMRSDFIGDCAAYPGLTQMINTSNYLVPQMSREQMRLAVLGPVAVGGGRISSRLVKRLVTDIGDSHDQLPILQHALMRTWDYWIENHDPREPLDVRHYNAVGKITQALSLHANEAFDELTIREREIAEVLFKSITEKNQENQGMRRPARVNKIAELAEASEQEVILVAEKFRKGGRSFLMPGQHVALSATSVIELSHESMMRIWTRLQEWVNEEYESALMYKKLSEAAGLYQVGKTSLWRPPDLQLALNWQKKQKPNRTWAQRYDEAFERAIVFLDTSRITYEAELQNQERLQKRMLRRARVTSIILGIALLISLFFFFFGLTQQIAAERAAVEANLARDNAIEQEKKAEVQKKIAEDRADEIEKQKVELQKVNDNLETALIETDKARKEAVANFNEAQKQTNIAQRESENARRQTDIAVKEYERAELALKDNNRLLMLSIAQSMEAKSAQEDEKELAGLLAMQGYLFHTANGGLRYDHYVFNGLYHALTKLYGSNYNAIKVPGNFHNKMYALAISKNSNTLYVTGNDGRIFKGDYATQTVQNQVGANAFPNRVLALSNDENYLVNGSDSSFIQIYNLTGSAKPQIVKGHSGFVNAIKFLPDNSGFISAASDRSLRFTNHLTGQSRQIALLPFDLKAIDISRDGNWLVGASISGNVVRVNLKDFKHEILANESPSRVLSIAFHPTRNMIAYGIDVVNERGLSVRGAVKLFDLNEKSVVKELSGHHAGVSDIEFSPDGLLLATAGYDHKLHMWVVDHEQDLPIDMDSNNGNIWDIGFAKGSDFLIASCNNGEIRIWPTDPKALAEQVCPRLTRNMTPEEWKIYVANNIEYESTCKSLLINNF